MADEQILNPEQNLMREQMRSRENDAPQSLQMMQGQAYIAN